VTNSIVPRVGMGPAGVQSAVRSPVWLIEQLPNGLLDADFFVRFVSIFQELGAGLLDGADNIDNLLELSVTPEPLVRWLGSWIGVTGIDPSLPHELQRRIVASSAETLTWRGTARGLRRFLELASGGPAEVEEGGGIWRDSESPEDTAWVRMTVDSTGWLPEGDFITLVRDEVPAHVHAELYVGDRCVWRSEGVTE